MAPSHLRWSDASVNEQTDQLRQIVRASPVLIRTLRVLRTLDLPDAWIVSGAIYNQVWNHLTGRPEMYGVKDIDVFYFDRDESYEAEDTQIRHAAKVFPPSPPIEIRNQARVHLWYEDHFGHPYPKLSKSPDAIDMFACKTHCVGLHPEAGDDFAIYAPFGLSDIFGFRITPNTRLPNRATHEAKAARQKSLWPELTIVPWPVS
jgi:hypothetical protein